MAISIKRLKELISFLSNINYDLPKDICEALKELLERKEEDKSTAKD